MRVSSPRQSVIAIAGGVAATLAPVTPTLASGFALLEQSASRLGTAFAGTASLADDATTLFYNPAGLAALKSSQLAVVVSGVNIGSEFGNSASEPALGQPLGNEGGDAGGWNAVPAAYLALPLNERLALGLALNAPYGLKLEYTGGWIGRFQALNSEIQTYGVAPAIAFNVNDVVMLGATVGYQRADAELTNAVNYSAVVAGGLRQLVTAGQLPPAAVPGLLAANAGLEGATRLKGDDDTWTWSAGALFTLQSGTKIGISYRSSADYTIDGTVQFNEPQATNPVGAGIIAAAAAGQLADGAASVKIELPAIATASISHAFNERLTLMADVAWTEWSSVPELRVVRDSGAVLSVTPEQWRDTWRYAIGATLNVGDAWTLRAGLAYDETPVPDSTRTPRLPDAERTWVAIGAQWRPGGAFTIDAGYAHLFSDDVPLDQNAGSTEVNARLLGEQASGVDIVGVQVSFTF